MPSTPTTKSQVQAYQFVLRRMQSALVRKDAVMLHEPMRTHTRATIVGVCIAAVGVIGVLIFGLLSPAPKAPSKDSIIIAKPSGAVYVLLEGTPKGTVLVPTFNLASARLLLQARKGGGQQQQQGGQGEQTAAVMPDVIPDDKLVNITRDRLTGIPDGPQLLPEDGQRVSGDWAVCDEYKLDSTLNNSASQNKVETTVSAGHSDFGPELSADKALLVKAQTGKTYLVYRNTPNAQRNPNANAVRAEVDMTNQRLIAALGLRVERTRTITTGLLNAIPEAPALKAPPVADMGTQSQVSSLSEFKVGTIVEIQRSGESFRRLYLVLRDGAQEIKRTTGDLIRFGNDGGVPEIKLIDPFRIPAQPPSNPVDESTFPDVIPEVLDPQYFPVACLAWSTVGDGPNLDERTKVHVGKQLPLPRTSTGEPATVSISTPSADGQRLDHFYMPPGRAAVVRDTTSKQDFATGPIYLVSDRGVKFGVPDAQTAAALGLANQRPAPDAIMRLLPSGASLNTRDVLQTYDSAPVAPGQFPSTTAQPQPGG